MRGARAGLRRGNILVLVCILSVVIFVSLFALGFLTKTDVRTSSNLLREILATSLAESIATQMEAQANSKPWADRFWLDPAVAPPALMTFDRSCSYVNLSKESVSASDYDFAGVIKDLPSELREYRIFISVTLKNETYNFTWDKRWEMALLTGLNRDTTMMDKTLEQAPATESAVDALINDIKQKVEAAPPPDRSPQAQRTRIKALRKDEKSFKATAELDKSGKSKPPTLPPTP